MLFGKELAEGADGAEKRHPQEKAPPSGAPHERGHWICVTTQSRSRKRHDGEHVHPEPRATSHRASR